MPGPGEAVDAYLDAQRDVLTRDARDLYNGESVHGTRVAARRLRSVLRVFADLFDPVQAAELDSELRWFSSLLGDVRDLQILRVRLSEMIVDLQAELGLDTDAGLRIETVIDSREQHARRALQHALVSQRYDGLLSAVVATAPAGDGTRELEEYFDAAQRTARRRVRRAERLPVDDHTKNEHSHRARKAVKRARYVAELAEPVLGRRAQRMIARWRRVQDELGVRQDTVFAAEFLRSAMSDPDEFALGVLWERSRRS